MAVIKMSDGSTIKTSDKVADLRGKLSHERWLMVKDKDGTPHDLNREHIVYLRDG